VRGWGLIRRGWMRFAGPPRLGAKMAHRRIGQETLRFSGTGSGLSSLDRLALLIDWMPVEALLSDIHSATKGEPAWPPLALFKAMLIAV
jgi:IS5 family transposase